MPGRLPRNLRSGNVAEDFGVVLLKPFCAVAPVPRTEDVGLDAIATVLRPEGRSWHAGGSFWVQFKAASVRSVTYDEGEAAWLRGLALPLFIGSVDLATGEIALYTTHRATCRVDFDAYREVTLCLDPPPEQIVDRNLHQHLGEPVLRWTGDMAQEREFQELACAVLSRWVSVEQVHLARRPIRASDNLRWSTNGMPEVVAFLRATNPGDLDGDLRAAAPYLEKIGMHLMAAGEASPEAAAFLVLAQWLEEKGAMNEAFALAMRGFLAMKSNS